MIITGYHTLENKDNIDEVEMDGPFDCTRRGAWLGPGSYFWDTNIKWAHEWGRIGYHNIKKKYIICSCQLDLSKNCFDLVGSVQHQTDLMECIDVMIKSRKIANAKEAVIPNLIQFMKNQGIFPFHSIRAADMHRGIMRVKFRGDREEYMIVNQRVQVCVIERKTVILPPLKVVYIEK